MLLSEIARYRAARVLTRIERRGTRIEFHAPFACPGFTVGLDAVAATPPRFEAGTGTAPLAGVSRPLDLRSGSRARRGRQVVACFDLPQGRSTLPV